MKRSRQYIIEKKKLFLFSHMFMYLKKYYKLTKLLDLISQYGKVPVYKVNIKINCFCILTTTKKEVKLFSIASKN